MQRLELRLAGLGLTPLLTKDTVKFLKNGETRWPRKFYFRPSYSRFRLEWTLGIPWSNFGKQNSLWTTLLRSARGVVPLPHGWLRHFLAVWICPSTLIVIAFASSSGNQHALMRSRQFSMQYPNMNITSWPLHRILLNFLVATTGTSPSKAH